MKSKIKIYVKTAAAVFFVVVIAVADGCNVSPATTISSSTTSSAPSVMPVSTPASAPSVTPGTALTPVPATTSAPPPSEIASITIIQPGNNIYVVGTGDIEIIVRVSGIDLVGSIAQSNVPGQAHIIYYLNVPPPTTPGKPALTAEGTYAVSSSTSHTWPGLSEGVYTFSVELVNNDNSPLSPPVTANVTVSVYPG